MEACCRRPGMTKSRENRSPAAARRHAVLIAIVILAACGTNPAEPDGLALGGVYSLALTRCGLAEESATQTAMTMVVPDQNFWTLAQSGERFSAQAVGSLPPFTWSGTLSGTVSSAGAIEITSLQYTDGCSHCPVQTLTASGQATSDSTGITGTLTGDYSSSPAFGGASGPTSSCHGSQMAFRLQRER